MVMVVVMVWVMLPLAMLNNFLKPARLRPWCQFKGSVMSFINFDLLPLVEPEYSAVSVRPKVTMFTSCRLYIHPLKNTM